MNIAKLTTAAVLLWSGPAAFAASATAYSIATNGGSSQATSVAVGNADSTAIAGATNGGRAVANSIAIGRRRGYASSAAIATADRGLAVSNSRADAEGRWGGRAVANSESLAATIGGVAISNSDSRARGGFGGTARSDSYSTALSRWGFAHSDSQAISRGWFGGRATSVSDSLADTYGGVSTSRVVSDSEAGYRASAHSDGIGLSVSGPGRHSRVSARAISKANRLGRGQSRAVGIEVRR